jgi:hypothetical protein
MATKNTIKIKNYSDIFEEYVANAAIIPGMLIELMSTGKVRAHATAGGPVLPMFALEDEFQGNPIDTAYAADATIPQCWIPGRGDQVNALLDDGEKVVIGDKLESAGNGFLQKWTADVTDSAESDNIQQNQIVAIALEAVDLESSSDTWPTAGRRILIRIV